MRNGLPCRSLGDKSYRHPEYRPEFFKEGGLATGSTFHRGSFPKTVARNTTGWKEFEAQRPDAVRHRTYQQVVADQRYEEEKQSVNELVTWERKQLSECEEAKYSPDSDSE